MGFEFTLKMKWSCLHKMCHTKVCVKMWSDDKQQSDKSKSQFHLIRMITLSQEHAIYTMKQLTNIVLLL